MTNPPMLRQSQIPPLALSNNSPSTSQESPALSALARWKPADRAPLTKEELLTVISDLSAKSPPATPQEYLEAMQDLAVFATAFGIACPSPEMVQEIYQEQLAALPGDLLKLAVKRVRGNWIWGNRMPFPGEIKALVREDHSRRTVLLGRAKVAVLKATDILRDNLIGTEKMEQARAIVSQATFRLGQKASREPEELTDEMIAAKRAEWAKAAEESENN